MITLFDDASGSLCSISIFIDLDLLFSVVWYSKIRMKSLIFSLHYLIDFKPPTSTYATEIVK